MHKSAAIERLAAMLIEQESRARDVARLLHDGPGQTLTAVGFHLSAQRCDKLATSELASHLERVMDDIRLACNKLQTNVVERSDLKGAIELFLKDFAEESGIIVKPLIELSHRFPRTVSHAVYRVIELAADNIRAHSGAKEMEVVLHGSPAGLDAEIRDNGRGFDVEELHRNPLGAGLVLMDVYCRNAGLNLQVASRLEQGTIVRIRTA